MPEDQDRIETNKSPEDPFENITPESAEKLMALKLSKHLSKVLSLARQYRDSSRYSPWGPFRTFNDEDKQLFEATFSTYELQHSELPLNGMMVIAQDFTPEAAEHADKVDIKTSKRLVLPVYTDIQTRDKFLEHMKNNEKVGPENLQTYYYFNEEGEFKKIQQTDTGFNPGKKILYTKGSYYSTPVHGFASPIEIGDYELAQTALHLMEKHLEERMNPSPTEDQA